MFEFPPTLTVSVHVVNSASDWTEFSGYFSPLSFPSVPQSLTVSLQLWIIFNLHRCVLSHNFLLLWGKFSTDQIFPFLFIQSPHVCTEMVLWSQNELKKLTKPWKQVAQSCAHSYPPFFCRAAATLGSMNAIVLTPKTMGQPLTVWNHLKTFNFFQLQYAIKRNILFAMCITW